MKRKKFRLLTGVIAALMLGMCLSGCNKGTVSEGEPVDNESSYDETGYISIEGDKFHLPLKVADFEEKGYTLDVESLGIQKDEKLPKNNHYNEYILLLKGSSDIGVKCKVVNLEEEDKGLHDCSIYSLRFSNSNNIISLQNGITIGDTMESINKVFGEPLDTKKDGDFTLAKYSYLDKGFLKVEFAGDVSISMEYCMDDISL